MNVFVGFSESLERFCCCLWHYVGGQDGVSLLLALARGREISTSFTVSVGCGLWLQQEPLRVVQNGDWRKEAANFLFR